MRPSLLQYLACPTCRGALSLSGRQGGDGSVREGGLTCLHCHHVYPIRQGIPRFADNDPVHRHAETVRMRRAYDFTWRHISRHELEQGWEKDSYQYDAVIPREAMQGTGRVGLDAGCGGGTDLARLAASGTTLIGFDLSDGVETAAERTRGLPNVEVVQGDLRQLPFRPASFDFIYSFGVLHHLPDPAEGVRNLARLLKPGAPLITYLYEDFSDRSGFERAVLGAVRGIRRVTSRLPPSWLYALCWLMTPMAWSVCALPAWGLRRCGASLAKRIPFRHTVRWPVLASDLFDRFAPPVEWRFSREGILQLYESVGLERVAIHRSRGWVSWAFAPETVDAIHHETTAGLAR